MYSPPDHPKFRLKNQLDAQIQNIFFTYYKNRLRITTKAEQPIDLPKWIFHS